MAETVKLELEIPKPVYDCLVYYMRHTIHWCGDEREKTSAAGYIIHMVKIYLEMESTNPHDATEYLRHVMENDHLPNLS